MFGRLVVGRASACLLFHGVERVGPHAEGAKCKSVWEMHHGGTRGSAISQDLNNRSGQFLCGRCLRYEGIRANQPGCRWGFMNAEKYDSSRRGDSTDLFSRIKAAQNGHRQV